MLNPTAWNWGAKTGKSTSTCLLLHLPLANMECLAFFWAGMTLLCILWTYFRLPETKGFTFAEIDRLFEQRYVRIPPARSKEAQTKNFR